MSTGYLANSKTALNSAAEFSAGAQPALSDRFDVVVVGGGAVGCAVAWEAASRGLHTALLERDDFGAATSANSLRIVHGGLRYLQTLNLRRARASSKERAIMLRIAPHLVSPLECVVPTFRSLKRGRMAFAVGLGINRLLTVGHNQMLAASHRLGAGGIISEAKLAQRAPGLAMKDVTGGARWFDGCMTSGERLALAFALSAREQGAVVLNHVEVERALTRGGRISGVAARDALSGESLELAAKVVLDCRGFGLSSQPTLFGDPGFELEFVKAVNIILGDQGLECAVGAPSRDARGDPVPGRMIFACPVEQTTVVGTWYFSQDSTSQEIVPGELEAILQVVNGAFPGWHVTPDDVLRLHVGFLPRGNATGIEPLPIERPILSDSAAMGGLQGLWHVQTEKWTTVRALAERSVSLLAQVEDLSAAPSRTHEQSLVGGGPVSLSADQSTLLATLSTRQSSRITSHYGSRAGIVLNYILKGPSLAKPVPAAPAIIQGELSYVLDHELVRSPKDMVRRIAPDQTDALAPETVAFLTEFMSARRDLSHARQQDEFEDLQTER